MCSEFCIWQCLVDFRVKAMLVKLSATWSACAEASPDLLLVTKVRPFMPMMAPCILEETWTVIFFLGWSTESPLCPLTTLWPPQKPGRDYFMLWYHPGNTRTIWPSFIFKGCAPRSQLRSIGCCQGLDLQRLLSTWKGLTEVYIGTSIMATCLHSR